MSDSLPQAQRSDPEGQPPEAREHLAPTPDLRATVSISSGSELVSASSDDQGFELVETPVPTPNPPVKTRKPFDFGKYELYCELGRGGMGVVYQARQKDLDRVVALKMILSSHLASADQIERFYAEARAAARLRSPHIVGIHEVGEHRGQHYFAMEYIAGQSLGQLLKAGPLDPREAARLLVIVARAVQYLHRQGMIHRDLKPSNILLDEMGQPFVSDFGLARAIGPDDPMSHSETIVGTPNYMAPEQATATNASAVGPTSDVYSLGAILYECLTGQPPCSGPSPMETLVQVLEGEPDRPRRLNPRVPAALERICLKCLEKSPEGRYASAEALASDLEHFLQGEQVEATGLGPWQRLRRWARREPALVSRLGTMAICGAIIQVNRYIIGSPQIASRPSIAVVIAWAMASLMFQWILRHDRWANLGRYAWAATDVGLFTALVVVNDGLHTSLVAGYFLLVSASGLWFRERLVWLTTGLSVVAYGVLAITAGLPHTNQDSPYRHIIFASVLAVCGLIVSYQVRRVRALSNYYEHRPLP
ncbi:hypothetical protein BH23PLA1_BH23PLA1_42290 [soil metagenome]